MLNKCGIYKITNIENNKAYIGCSSNINRRWNVHKTRYLDKTNKEYNKVLYICQVGDVNVNSFLILRELDDNNEMDVDVTIAISLVKEQKMDMILQKLTELGVKKIIPVKMERSIVKLDNKRAERKLDRWRTICKEAAEQSKRNIIPEVTNIMTIDELDGDYDLKCVCSVSNKENLVNKYLQKNKSCAKMIFVIGSEGGISPKEEKKLNDMGFVSVSLGKLVLRVETAAIYVASILRFSSMR